MFRMNRLALLFPTVLSLAGAVPAASQPVTADISPDQSSLHATDPNGAAGGRVNHLAAAPGGRVFYAASEWGGIWRGADGGQKWVRLDSHIPTATWDVEVDPTDGNRVYATSFYDGRIESLAGINVSTDGGATWTHPATARPPAGFCNGEDRRNEPSAFGIAVDPASPDNVYVGTNCGLAISRDRGVTWSFVDPSPGDRADDVYDVIVHHGGILDVCGGDGHRRSTNGGATWTVSSALISGVCSLAASPDESYVLFAVVGTSIFESDDGGVTWPVRFVNPSKQGRIPFVQANDRAGTAFDLWFGDTSLHQASCATPANPAPGGNRRCPLSNTWAGPFTSSVGGHDDTGDVAFAPGVAVDACPLLLSSDGGIYVNTRTTSPSCHTPAWEQPRTAPHALWQWDMAGARQDGEDSEDLYFGNQDNGSFGSRDAGLGRVAWNNQECCDSFDVAAEPSRVVSTICCYNSGRATRLHISNPGLTGGGPINSSHHPPGDLQAFEHLDSIVNFGPADYAVITSEGVHVTTDITAQPIAWSEIGSTSGPPSACGIQVASSGGPPTFFVKSGGCNGDRAGSLWRHNGAGAGGTWTQVAVPAGMVGVYAVDPVNPRRLLASSWDGAAPPAMVLSTDGGSTWSPLPALDAMMSGGPGPAIYRLQNRRGPISFSVDLSGYPQPTLVAFDPHDADVILAGAADAGLFVSHDAGASWTRLTDPPGFHTSCTLQIPRPQYAHFDHDSPGKIRAYVGTKGRGVWRLELPTSLSTTLGSNEADDRFASAVAAGDFDGDGLGDLAIGAPGESPDADPKSGYVFVLKGTPHGLRLWHGFGQSGLGTNEAGDRFGTALAAGDFDGDGKDDLAVGAPGEAPDMSPASGHVFVFRGTANGLTPWKGLDQAGLDSNELDDRFGQAVAAGDFNHDGNDDLAVGAPGEAPGTSPRSGSVYVFRGGAPGFAAWKRLDQAGLGTDELDDRFGQALAAGDLDGDGTADLAVGAPGEAPDTDPKSGYVFLFRGGASGPTAWKGLDQTGLGTNELDDRFGEALAIGDLSGDGKGDLAVGAPGETPGNDPRSGYVFLFRGDASGASPWQGLDQAGLGSNDAGDLFGSDVAIGDYSGDGIADLAVGAPGEAPTNGPKSGYAFLFRGGAGGVSTWVGLSQSGLGANEADDRFGAALAAVDFNGDGIVDLGVGAPGEALGGAGASGEVFTFKGVGSTLADCRAVTQIGG